MTPAQRVVPPLLSLAGWLGGSMILYAIFLALASHWAVDPTCYKKVGSSDADEALARAVAHRNELPRSERACFPESSTRANDRPDRVTYDGAAYIPVGKCYCEQITRGAISQKLNTHSNWITVLFGIFILLFDALARDRSDPAGPLRDNPFYGAFYGGVVIFLGTGSMFFHSALREPNGIMDSLSMSTFVFFLLWYDLARVLRKPVWWFVLWYSVSIGTALVVNIILSVSGLPISTAFFAVQVVGIFSVELYYVYPRQPNGIRRRWYWMIPWVLAFSTALNVWSRANGPDEPGPLCCPTDVFFGHPLWHLLAGIAATVVYFYLRDDREDAGPRTGKWVAIQRWAITSYLCLFIGLLLHGFLPGTAGLVLLIVLLALGAAATLTTVLLGLEWKRRGLL